MREIRKIKTPTERERSILKLVVEDYIQTASPVPSMRLKEKFNISFSPATIRNTLHALEETGFLDHIYTSSGRIPTDSGYRFYVDELLEEVDESVDVKERFMDELVVVALNVDEILQVAANSLAQISNLFGFVLLASYRSSKLIDLDLMCLSSGHVLLILGFQSDQIKTVVLNVSIDVRESLIETVASILRERLCGLTLDEIQKSIGDRLKDQEVFKSEIIQIIVENAESYFSTKDIRYICTSQKDLLLQHPEFTQTDKIQSIVTALDDEAVIIESVPLSASSLQMEIFIGKENSIDALQNCSIVSRGFGHGNLLGQLGIIGPTRMSYGEVQTLVNTFASIMSEIYGS